MELDPRLRTALTLGALGLLLVVGATWGWGALTEPLPDRSAPPPAKCLDETFAKGEKVRIRDVTVSVFNAGSTEGLAERVLSDLVDRGFGRGDMSNAPNDVEVARVEIWTAEPQNPAVRLVASQFGPEVVVRPTRQPPLGVGVVVIVGDSLGDLDANAPRAATAQSAATVCTPNPEAL